MPVGEGHKLGEVADVDQLDRVVAATGCEHLAAALETHRPVREAVGGITRADDVGRADDEAALTEGLEHVMLALCLGHAVGLGAVLGERARNLEELATCGDGRGFAGGADTPSYVAGQRFTSASRRPIESRVCDRLASRSVLARNLALAVWVGAASPA